MSREPVGNLSESERQALRLWRQRKTAKEIGRVLGITHFGVNERLRTARRKLGVATSNEAAEMLAAAEGGGTYKGLVYEPREVAVAVNPAIMNGSEDGREQPSRLSRNDAVQEEQVAFQVTNSSWVGARLPIPAGEGDRNRLSVRSRLLWIGALALAIVVAVGTLITISSGVVRLVAQVSRIFS